MRGWPVAAVAATVLFSGCFGGADDGAPATDLGWAARALASGHDHADPLLHEGMTTPNFQILGHDPLVGDFLGTTDRGNLCGDARAVDGGRRLAAVESRGDVGFTLVDVTDAADPKWLGELVMRRTYVYDLAVVPDGLHVVLVTSNLRDPDQPDGLPNPPPSPTPPDPPVPVPYPPPLWRSPCATDGGAGFHEVAVGAVATEDQVPRPFSLILVSIEDPANPVIVDQRPLAQYGHSVSSWDLDGRLWVIATALACNHYTGCPSGVATFQFYEIVSTPEGARLSHLSTYSSPTSPITSADFYEYEGHNDAWLAKHPGTGTTLAWLAHWDQGLVMLDMTDPLRPEVVGRWSDHDPARPDPDTGDVHSVHPLSELIDGRHYTVIGPELLDHPTDTPTGVVHVLDTTDPAAPMEVAAWTLPHDVTWEDRLQFSTHYLTVVGRTAFISMYHAGVWAMDLAGLGGDFHVLPSVGVFMPVGRSPSPPAAPLRWTPTLEEVHAMPDGTLVTFDSNTGVYTFRFDATMVLPPPEPWPLVRVGASR